MLGFELDWNLNMLFQSAPHTSPVKVLVFPGFVADIPGALERLGASWEAPEALWKRLGAVLRAFNVVVDVEMTLESAQHVVGVLYSGIRPRISHFCNIRICSSFCI